MTNPGARSLGGGGAFLSLADDATTAFTNPAGLTNMSKPEISLEGRYFEFKNEFLDSGHAFGPPSGKRVDTIAGTVFSSSTAHTTGLSFASFVFPAKNWAVAVYRHELARFEVNTQSAGTFFDVSFKDSTGSTMTATTRVLPVISSEEFRIINYGISGAFRIADNVTLGVGAIRSDLTFTSDLTRFVFGDLYEPPNFDPVRRSSETLGNGKDHDYVFNAGLLWKASRRLSVGATYRKGPRFDVTLTSLALLPAGPATSLVTQLKVPDVYGLGLTLRPTDFFSVSVDYDRVRWSQLSDNLSSSNPFAPLVPLESRDADEVRLGIQYVVPAGTNVVAFRAGAWRDPDHDLHAVGADLNSNDDAGTALTRATARLLFPGGKTVYHYTAGVGVAIGEHFQIDAGADLSTVVKTGSLSLVARF